MTKPIVNMSFKDEDGNILISHVAVVNREAVIHSHFVDADRRYRRFITRIVEVIEKGEAPIKVEIERVRSGNREEETAEFNTMEEATDWADVMRLQFGYRKVYINGVPYNGKT